MRSEIAHPEVGVTQLVLRVAMGSGPEGAGTGTVASQEVAVSAGGSATGRWWVAKLLLLELRCPAVPAVAAWLPPTLYPGDRTRCAAELALLPQAAGGSIPSSLEGWLTGPRGREASSGRPAASNPSFQAAHDAKAWRGPGDMSVSCGFCTSDHRWGLKTTEIHSLTVCRPEVQTQGITGPCSLRKV